ncbi:MAG: TonB-dependent receptor [Massilia sp.]
MNMQRTLLASALLSVFTSSVHAATEDADVTKVIVTATPFRGTENEQILAPAKVLSGDELRDKLGNSLGDTLSQELGVSASAFGAGASRPIIRGLEGARVKMLENGMAVADVSGLSNDHAVAAEGAIAQQIEVLRGPAALLYGSGAIGGLVNVVNERIPTALEATPVGQLETRYSTVDSGSSLSGTADAAFGKLAVHLDGNARNTDDYKIPGNRVLGDPASASGRLPHSDTRERTAGLGASLVENWGYVGASVSTLSNLYGIPSDEGSRIDQHQTRYDIDSLINSPFSGIESLRFKIGYTDYRHAELNPDNTPAVNFKNRALESRWEMTHRPIGNWHGTFGMQTENTHFSALSAEGGPDTVPVTHSSSTALFAVEEIDIGALRIDAGARLEDVKREPVSSITRSFQLSSYSLGAQWRPVTGYAVGLTASLAQRAPAAEELYSGGPHDATVTFDTGNPDFKKEVSRNVELSVQKTSGYLQWKANLFQNNVSDFIYGHITGQLVDEEGNPGGEFRERIFEQADARLHGAEAELTLNHAGPGWSARLFADMARGALVNGGNLPLQPATRLGASVGYRAGPLRAGLSLVHAAEQDRLATFEDQATPSYNQVNANLAYTTHAGTAELTWFLVAKNLLNEDIRASTSVLKDISPLPGRNLTMGVRAKF